MNTLLEYLIPIKGLKNGVHEYHFQVDSRFFRHFPSSPIEEGNFDLALTLEKKPDFLSLEFNFEGTVRTECDRCLVPIGLPLHGHQTLLVKFDESGEAQEEADVVYISRELSQFDAAPFVYEFICLALPIIKVYDCENDDPRPCNEEMLSFLTTENDDSDTSSNPLWDALKDFEK